MSGERRVEVVKRERAFQGYFGVDRLTVRHSLFRGGMSPPLVREVFERGHAATVLPYDPARDEVVLIEQFRPGALDEPRGAWTIESIAGIIDGADGAEATVHREAREEASLDLAALIPIGDILASPGCMTETFKVFLGRVSTDGVGGLHGKPDEGEDIRVLVVPLQEAMRMVADGRIRVSHTVIALQWLALHRDDVRARWRAGG